MKVFLICMSVSLSFSAMACPNLSGSYKCGKDSDGKMRYLNISQNGINFKIAGPGKRSEEKSEIKADGKFYQFNSDGYSSSLLSKCVDENTLKQQVKIKIEKESLAEEIQTSYIKISDNTIKYTSHTILVTDELNSNTVMTLNCTK